MRENECEHSFFVFIKIVLPSINQRRSNQAPVESIFLSSNRSDPRACGTYMCISLNPPHSPKFV